ncbi:hypothetical protein CK503_00235 [Aliifodinibius salipaludis]|uniref:Uncharacterized protein n=1 Tax=Fodinibius salipaludis TaxID=2032627 RepID=A0A2A2GDT2_9BACT|nr:hypothetical protein [Aliifodinibius salipaludis]PAU95528.1 hypothetical protein CK503_00235 [Aliifodinibius salipaludis]
MNTGEELSNTFLIHGFILIVFLIIIFGAVSAVFLIKALGHIISSGSISISPTFVAVGVLCVVLMPYCFHIVKTLQIMEISDFEANKQKILLHRPIFVNDMNHPDEIELNQITSMTQGSLFANLMEFTFVENEKKENS